MPPSQPPDQSPRAAYRAFIDTFFPADAGKINEHLDAVVPSVAQRAQVSSDAVWQALCGGIHEWQRQRILTRTIRGGPPSPDDHPMKEAAGFHPNWLLNRSVAEIIRAHQQAAKHLHALEDWAKEFSSSDDQPRAPLADPGSSRSSPVSAAPSSAASQR